MLDHQSPEQLEQPRTTPESSLLAIEESGNASENDPNTHHAAGIRDASSTTRRYPVEEKDDEWAEEERQRHNAGKKNAQQQQRRHNELETPKSNPGAVNTPLATGTAPLPRNAPSKPTASPPRHSPPPLSAAPPVTSVPAALSSPSRDRSLGTPSSPSKPMLPSSLSTASLMQVRPSLSSDSDPPHPFEPRSQTSPLRQPRSHPTLDVSALAPPTAAGATSPQGCSPKELGLPSGPLSFASPPVSCASTTWRTLVNGVVAATHLLVDLSSLQRELSLGQPGTPTQPLPHEGSSPKPSEGGAANTKDPAADVPLPLSEKEVATAKRAHGNRRVSAAPVRVPATAAPFSTVLPAAAATSTTASPLSTSRSDRCGDKQRGVTQAAASGAEAPAAATAPDTPTERGHRSGSCTHSRSRGERTTTNSPDSQLPPLTDATNAPLSSCASCSEDCSTATGVTAEVASRGAGNGNTRTPSKSRHRRRRRSATLTAVESRSCSGSAGTRGEARSGPPTYDGAVAVADGAPRDGTAPALATKADIRPSSISNSNAAGTSAVTNVAAAASPVSARGTPSPYPPSSLSRTTPSDAPLQPPPPPLLPSDGVGAGVANLPSASSHLSPPSSPASASAFGKAGAVVVNGEMPLAPVVLQLAPAGEEDVLTTDLTPLSPSQLYRMQMTSSHLPMQPHIMPPPSLTAALTPQKGAVAAQWTAASTQPQQRNHHDLQQPPPTTKAPISLSSSLALRGLLMLDAVPHQRSNEASATHLLSHGNSATIHSTPITASTTLTTNASTAGYCEGHHDAVWAPPSTGREEAQMLPHRYGDAALSAKSLPPQRICVPLLAPLQPSPAAGYPSNPEYFAHHHTPVRPAAAAAGGGAYRVLAVGAAGPVAPWHSPDSPANTSVPLARVARGNAGHAGSSTVDATHFHAAPQIVPAASQEFFVRGAQRTTGGATGRNAPAAATVAAGAGYSPQAVQVTAPVTATTAAVPAAATRGAGRAGSPLHGEGPALARLPPEFAYAPTTAASPPVPSHQVWPDSTTAPLQTSTRSIVLPPSDAGITLTESCSVPEELLQLPASRPGARPRAPRDLALEMRSIASSGVGPPMFAAVTLEPLNWQETQAWLEQTGDDPGIGSSVHASRHSRGGDQGIRSALEVAVSSPSALSPAGTAAPMKSAGAPDAPETDPASPHVAERCLAPQPLLVATEPEPAWVGGDAPDEASYPAPEQPPASHTADSALFDRAASTSVQAPARETARPARVGVHPQPQPQMDAVPERQRRTSSAAQPPPPPPPSSPFTSAAQPAARPHSGVPSVVQEAAAAASGKPTEASPRPARVTPPPPPPPPPLPLPPPPMQSSSTAPTAVPVATASERCRPQHGALSTVAATAVPSGRVPLALPLHHIADATHTYEAASAHLSRKGERDASVVPRGGARPPAASGTPPRSQPPPLPMPMLGNLVSVHAIAASPYRRPATFNMHESRSPSRESADLTARGKSGTAPPPSVPSPPPPSLTQLQSTYTAPTRTWVAPSTADAGRASASSRSSPRPPPHRAPSTTEPAASPTPSPVQAREQHTRVTAATQTETLGGVRALPSASSGGSPSPSSVASGLVGVLGVGTPRQQAAAAPTATAGGDDVDDRDGEDTGHVRAAALAESAQRERTGCTAPLPAAALPTTATQARVPQRRSRMQMRGNASVSAAAPRTNSPSLADARRRGEGQGMRTASAAPAVQRRPHAEQSSGYGERQGPVGAQRHSAAWPPPPRAVAAGPRAEETRTTVAGMSRHSPPLLRADALPVAAGSALFPAHATQQQQQPPPMTKGKTAAEETPRHAHGAHGAVQHDRHSSPLANASARREPSVLAGTGGNGGNGGPVLERLEPIPVGRTQRTTAATRTAAASPAVPSTLTNGLHGAATHVPLASPELPPSQRPYRLSVKQPTVLPASLLRVGRNPLSTPRLHGRTGAVREVPPGSIDLPSSVFSHPSSVESACVQRHQLQTGCRSGLPRALPSLARTPDPLPIAMRTPLMQGGAAAAAAAAERRPYSTEPSPTRAEGAAAGVARRPMACRGAQGGNDTREVQQRQLPLPCWPGQDMRRCGGEFPAPVRGPPPQTVGREHSGGGGGGGAHLGDFLTSTAAPACSSSEDTPVYTRAGSHLPPGLAVRAAGNTVEARQDAGTGFSRGTHGATGPAPAGSTAVAGLALHRGREARPGTGGSGGSLPTKGLWNYYGAYQRARHQSGPSPLPSAPSQAMTTPLAHTAADAPHRVSPGEELGAPAAAASRPAYRLSAAAHLVPDRGQRPPRLTRALLDRLQRAQGPIPAAAGAASGSALLSRPDDAYAAIPEDADGDWLDDEAVIDDPRATPPPPLFSVAARVQQQQQQQQRQYIGTAAAPPRSQTHAGQTWMRQDLRATSPAAARPHEAAMPYTVEHRNATSPSPVPAAPALLPAEQVRRGLYERDGGASRVQPLSPRPMFPALLQRTEPQHCVHTRRVRRNLAGELRRHPAQRVSGVTRHLASPGLSAATMNSASATPSPRLASPPPPPAPVLTATNSVPPLPQAGRKQRGSAPTPSAGDANIENRDGTEALSELHSSTQGRRQQALTGRHISDFFRGLGGGRQPQGRRAWVAM